MKGVKARGQRRQTTESRLVSNYERVLETHNSAAFGAQGLRPSLGFPSEKVGTPFQAPHPLFLFSV